MFYKQQIDCSILRGSEKGYKLLTTNSLYLFVFMKNVFPSLPRQIIIILFIFYLAHIRLPYMIPKKGSFDLF